MNNIICEEIVGLFSSLQQRAPNATILNLSSKIKCTKNKTVSYLMGMDKSMRNNTIIKCVYLASKVKKSNIYAMRAMHNEIVERVRNKVAMRGKKKRRDVETKIRQIMAPNKNIDLCATLGCSITQQRDFVDIVRGDVINRYIVHLWHDKEINMDVVWSGRIVAKEDMFTDKPLLTILYWKSDKPGEVLDQDDYMGPPPFQQEEDAEKTPVCVYQLATDYFCEDMWFL